MSYNGMKADPANSQFTYISGQNLGIKEPELHIDDIFEDQKP